MRLLIGQAMDICAVAEKISLVFLPNRFADHALHVYRAGEGWRCAGEVSFAIAREIVRAFHHKESDDPKTCIFHPGKPS